MKNSNVIKMVRSKVEFPQRSADELGRYKKLHKTKRGVDSKGAFLNCRDINNFEFFNLNENRG